MQEEKHGSLLSIATGMLTILALVIPGVRLHLSGLTTCGCDVKQ